MSDTLNDAREAATDVIAAGHCASSVVDGYPWLDDYTLGHVEMDLTHREFVELIDELMRCGDREFPAVLDRLIEHTQRHFAQESEWMKAYGFPAVGCHDGEHQQVLASTLAVRDRVANGDLATGRYLVKLLAEWFPQHAASMDRALSGWIRDSLLGRSPRLGCGSDC